MTDTMMKSLLSIAGLIIIIAMVAVGFLVSAMWQEREADVAERVTGDELATDEIGSDDMNGEDGLNDGSGDDLNMQDGTGDLNEDTGDNAGTDGIVNEEPVQDGDRMLYPGEYASTYYASRSRMVARSQCLRGTDFPRMGSKLLYPIDAQDGDDADFVAVLSRVFDPVDASTLHRSLKNGRDDMNYEWICNPDDGTALVVTSAWTASGTRYVVNILSEDLLSEEWEWEEGTELMGESYEAMYVYSDGVLGDYASTPIIWFENVIMNDPRSWRIYEVDTFFGDVELVEECYVLAIMGEMHTSCQIVN